MQPLSVNNISNIEMGQVSRRIQHHPLIPLGSNKSHHASMSAAGQDQGIFMTRVRSAPYFSRADPSDITPGPHAIFSMSAETKKSAWTGTETGKVRVSADAHAEWNEMADWKKNGAENAAMWGEKKAIADGDGASHSNPLVNGNDGAALHDGAAAKDGSFAKKADEYVCDEAQQPRRYSHIHKTLLHTHQWQSNRLK